MVKDPLRDIQEEVPVGHDADDCEIWPGDITYLWEGREVVLETFRDAVSNLLQNDPQQVALEMGIEMIRYG